jgi:hypothetical protein
MVFRRNFRIIIWKLRLNSLLLCQTIKNYARTATVREYKGTVF